MVEGANPPFHFFRGRWLSEIVAEDGEEDGELPLLPQRSDLLLGRVEGEKGVDPDIPFGVPFRILGAALEGAQLRKEALDDAEAIGPLEPERGAPGLEEQLLDLPPDPLDREVAEIDPPAKIGRVIFDGELEAGGELDGAQDPKAVLDEGPGVDRPENPGFQVGLPAPRVDRFAGERVVEDRVDGEISPPARLLEGKAGFPHHGESPVSRG